MRIILKIWPYFACAAAGCAFYQIGKFLTGDLKILFQSVAAAFLSVPCLFLIYDLSTRFSKSRLNKEIFDYGKLQIDTEILSVINQLSKIIFQYDQRDHSFKGIEVFLSLEKLNISGMLTNSKYLGFQVMKKWEVSQNNLHDIITNAFFSQRMNDEQLLSIIAVLKGISRLESIQQIDGLFEISNKKDTDYQIQTGRSLSPANSKYPDRYLLLYKLKDDKYVVSDFGDFPAYKAEKLLNICTIQHKYIDLLTDAVSSLIDSINRWLKNSGGEFIIDSKMFRVYPRNSNI